MICKLLNCFLDVVIDVGISNLLCMSGACMLEGTALGTSSPY